MKKISLLLVLLVLISGCQSEPETIRIGVNDWPPCEVWYVALEQDLFEDVNVELVRFSTWSDNMNALYLGNIDITHSTYFNNILFSEKGEWGQMIAPIDTTLGGDGLVIRNTLKSGYDLKGMKIAVEVGTDEHYLLYKALEHFDVRIEDVEIVSASSAKTAELFINNEVDAIFTYEPYMSQAATEGDGQIIYTTADIPGHMVDVLVGNKTRMDEHTEAFVNVMKGYYEARVYIDQTQDFDMMAANEQMDPEFFGAFYNSFQLFRPTEAKEIMDSDNYRAIHDEMAQFVLDYQLANQVKTLEDLMRDDIINGVIGDEK